MKNIKSLLTLMAIPFSFSITSCNNDSVYKINLDNIEKIISLVDVKYAQLDESCEMKGPSGKMTETGKDEMSPTVYHGIGSGEVENFEKYVYIEGNKIMETRLEGESWTKPEETVKANFKTPQIRGNAIKEHYTIATKMGSSLTFNKRKKCYATSFTASGTITFTEDIEFYFKNNKLIKFFYIDTSGENSDARTLEITYKEFTPVVPKL